MIGKAFDEYLVEHLGLDSYFISTMGPLSLKRVPFGPGTKIRIDSVEAREVVKGAARDLVGKGRDYGVRLELPNHLKSAMSALQSVSYDLKQRHPVARRDVLFEDSTMDLASTSPSGRGSPGRGLPQRKL